MIPHFKQGDYFGGIEAAVAVVCPIAAGEYSKERYEKDSGNSLIAAFAGLFGALLIFFIIVKVTGKSGGGGKGNSGTGTFGPGGIFIGGLPLGGFGSHRGSRGSDFGGFGDGGFGGFGGGSFGGGGAGGSW